MSFKKDLQGKLTALAGTVRRSRLLMMRLVKTCDAGFGLFGQNKRVREDSCPPFKCPAKF